MILTFLIVIIGHHYIKLFSSGNIDLVRYLLDHKANINARTNHGLTALIIACYNGYLDIIEILLTYGAKIDLRTNNV